MIDPPGQRSMPARVVPHDGREDGGIHPVPRRGDRDGQPRRRHLARVHQLWAGGSVSPEGDQDGDDDAADVRRVRAPRYPRRAHR